MHKSSERITRVVDLAKEVSYVVGQNLKDSNLDIAAGLGILGLGLVSVARSKRAGLLGIGTGFLLGAGFKGYLDGVDRRA